jgi:DNA recombination protein RmuC
VQDKNNLETDLAALQTESKERLQAADEKMQLLAEAEKKLSAGFENLANRIFEEKNKKFNEVSKTSMETMLNPVQQQLTNFRKKVEDIYDKENKERASLRTEIKLLKSLNERISTDALNLTRALKGDSKTRGTWGEVQLERLLEESGLTKGREFKVQKSLKNGDGKRLQPDVVIHLPEQKDVIIDSKVSLVAYEQYHSADADEAQELHLRHHITSLRKHFKDLSGKRYDDLIGVNSLDLVIMFVPIEPALLLALEHEPALFNEAYNLGILLVCPSTLMATLQIIRNIWRYEYQNRNVQKIADEAGNLHDKFVGFVESLEKIGVQIKRANESYEKAHKQLSSGAGNLIRRTNKLKVLGAKTKKTISAELLEAAAVEDNESETSLLDNEQTIEETAK